MRLQTPNSLILGAAAALAACSGTATQEPDPGPGTETPPGSSNETRPAGEPQTISVEGRIEAGVECSTIRTPDGAVWSWNQPEADFGPGDYVRMTGEVADASFCQQGEGTIIVERIDSIDPPARDRDPARAGGVALTPDYLTGSWVAKGVNANCEAPDFSVRETSGGLVFEAQIADHDDDARVVIGNYPRIDLDEPRQDLPIESRGPDGLAILRPATDAAYDPIRIGSARITGDGVVFVKCG